ncbi:MAG: hypothetical protein QG556_1155, partial [Pseudomonadota bacterium]|nr:hypothetical protein [Pseudomonadota bacterium]
MQNSLEKSLSNLKLYAQAFSPLIINLPAIISLPIILLSEFPFLIVSGLCFAIDVIVLQQFFSLKEENEQKIEQISNNAKFIKITLLPFIPETLKNVFPLSSVTDFCENNPDKALMIYNHLFNNKTQLLINKIMEISSLENLWQNPLILGQLLLSIPLFLLSCTSDFFNIFLFFPSLFVFVLGLYFSSAINRLWSQILTAPWVIYQTIYAQKQASPQAQEESNAVISSQNTQEAETSQNIVFDYDIQYVAELSTTNLKRDSIYFCEYTRAYVYLNQKNQINSGLISDEIDIKNHQKFHKHLLSII